METKTLTFNLNIAPDLWVGLQEKAARLDLNIGQVIWRLLTAWYYDLLGLPSTLDSDDGDEPVLPTRRARTTTAELWAEMTTVDDAELAALDVDKFLVEECGRPSDVWANKNVLQHCVNDLFGALAINNVSHGALRLQHAMRQAALMPNELSHSLIEARDT